ncbi:large subunit ribosomal protein L7e [Pancytospora epiphaga]|nr:large subunit ribosomal protein L7e [Pancytospora epiphaga]
MTSVVAPVSSIRKQEYEGKLNAALKQQEEALSKRIENNKQYARITSEKILLDIKAAKEEEAKKLASKDEFYVPAESNYIVAILVRSQKKIGPVPRKVLQLLRLTTLNSCVILRNNKSIKNMLQQAKDYIAYGFINYELLRTLLYKRGFGKIGQSKVTLSNENIETAFDGRFKCIEELAYAIYNGDDDIKRILNFIYPFKLSAPRGGFNGKKSKNYLQGGSTNNHKELLGNLLERMI